MKTGKTLRIKGHNAERRFKKEFVNIGFDMCVTSRYGSRLHDDAGIDLIHIPFNVQIKAGKQRNMNISKVLMNTKDMVKQLFPKNMPEHEYPTILIHQKEVGQGKTRTEFDDIVSMTFEDFKQLISKISWK